MIAIRCTKKLLERIGAPSPVTAPTTAILGDWYARPVAVSHQRLILLISEHSRLPVVMPARDVRHLATNFPEALSLVLLGLALPPSVVEREVAETREAVIAQTNNRSLLGTLNDFSYLLAGYMENAPELGLVDLALLVSRAPVAPLGMNSPDMVTRDLLAQSREEWHSG
jgi:hypothetical protein